MQLRQPVGVDLRQVSDGENHFCVLCPVRLLDLADAGVVADHPVRTDLHLVKTGDTYSVVGEVRLRARLDCSRCLRPFEEELSWTLEVVFQRAGKGQSVQGQGSFEEDLERIAHDATHIDLTERVREALLLALPIKPLCGPECAGLCPVCGQDLNVGRCSCHTSPTDPRCAGLRDLSHLAAEHTHSNPTT